MQKPSKNLIKRLSKDAQSAEQLNQLFDEIAAQYPSDDFFVDYEQFCEAIPQAIIIYDRNSKITHANRAAEELLGYTPQQMAGHRLNVPEWEATTEKFKPLNTSEHPVFDTLSRSKARHDVPVYLTRSDGTRLKLLMSSEPLYHKVTKRLMGAIAILTEPMKTEGLSAELEKERKRLLDEFLRDAAQEFRTPLATIHSKLYLMTRKHEELIDAREMISINHNLDRVVTLFDKLELMLKLEGSLRWSRRGVELVSTLNSVIDNHRYMYAGKIILDSDRSKYTVIATDELVIQAMNELLSNAIAFSPNHTDIIVRIRLGDQFVIVQVIDQGIGMDAEVLSRARERFFRADTIRKQQSFGLGLTLVQRIMNLHTKHFEIESKPNEGTTVTLGFDNATTFKRMMNQDQGNK